MALGALLLGPNAGYGPAGSPLTFKVMALDDAGVVQATPSLTTFTTSSAVANPGASGSTVTVTTTDPGNAQVWVSDGGSIVSNKVSVSTFDPEGGTSRRNAGR